MLLTFLWIAAALALSVTVRVNNELIPRGRISWDGNSWTFIPSGASSLPSSGLACAGIEENGNFECQHVFNLEENLRERYSIIADSQNHLRVSAMPGELQGEVGSATAIARPIPKKPQAIATGETAEEAPVKEKSFVVKYWYLIPIAFILLSAGGGKAQQ